jgi:hypothetical protein
LNCNLNLTLTAILGFITRLAVVVLHGDDSKHYPGKNSLNYLAGRSQLLYVEVPLKASSQEYANALLQGIHSNANQQIVKGASGFLLICKNPYGYQVWHHISICTLKFNKILKMHSHY